MIELFALALLVVGIWVVRFVDLRSKRGAVARMGRSQHSGSLLEVVEGEKLWAWRKGQFEPARVATSKMESPQKPAGIRTLKVAFESDPMVPVKLSAALIRKGSGQPEVASGREWHNRRRQAILSRFPEIRKIRELSSSRYVGLLLLFIFLHILIGAGIGFQRGADLLWFWVVLLAATVGAFCAFAFQQLTHELSHKKRQRITRILAFIADILVGTTGPGFFNYYLNGGHLRHHSNTGEDGDPDIITHGHWAVLPRWANGTRAGRFAWLTILGLFTFETLIIENLIGRVPQARISLRNRRLLVVLVIKYGFMALVWWLGGIWCLLYFRLSAGFSFGAFAHPYSGFWLMQHASVARHGYQPTLSYGGSMLWSWLTLGELYHVEHHDFPWIPFTKIQEVRKIAPEYYEDLWVVSSVWRLVWDWLSHTDGSPWMEVAGVLDCTDSSPNREVLHRPAPEVMSARG